MSGAIQKMTPLVARITRQTRSASQQIRSMAGDAHGEVKYNAWEKPTEIAQWKEEHIVFLVLGCWGVGITTAMKVFGGKKEAPAAEAAA
ncbi:hypothetical protein Ndes2526B_g07728 [Nannochloris sp. 'desiccata']|nr:hypothetical protein KSW81_002399 [Chlorella desiccata (nom. nud.)]KAH7617137.1 hypothetical protein NADE_006923 [Chlorella desiccata (nom. nud.)]